MSGVDFEGLRVWIVGASSGIGAALAEDLARAGARVAVSARRSDRLEQLEGCIPVELDVGVRALVDGAYDEVVEELGGLDMMIYAAGYWKQFAAREWDRESFERHFDVAIGGLNNVLGAVVPGFVAQGSGHVVGIASVAGFRGLPGGEPYGAAKAAQINLLEALRASLGPAGVDVTTVCPGFVDTEMTAGNDFPMPFMINAQEAAQAIIGGLEKGRREIIFPWQMAAAMRTARVVPGRLWDVIAARGWKGD